MAKKQMNSPTKGELTKTHIIETAALLFLKNGYCNTGISMILEELQLPKGSFYFHFESKNSLGISVAHYFGDQYTNWFQGIVDRTDNWTDFVIELVKDIQAKVEQNQFYGCPFSCFGTEASVVDSAIAQACTSSIQTFIRIFTYALTRTSSFSEESMLKGSTALSMYEGYLVYYRISGSPTVIATMQKSLLTLGGN